MRVRVLAPPPPIKQVESGDAMGKNWQSLPKHGNQGTESAVMDSGACESTESCSAAARNEVRVFATCSPPTTVWLGGPSLRGSCGSRSAKGPVRSQAFRPALLNLPWPSRPPPEGPSALTSRSRAAGPRPQRTSWVPHSLGSSLDIKDGTAHESPARLAPSRPLQEGLAASAPARGVRDQESRES